MKNDASQVVAAYERELHGRIEIMRESLQGDYLLAQGRAEVFAHDLRAWADALSPRFEKPLFDSALRQYEMGLLAIAVGWYRLAFFSLRLFVELTFATIYYSSREFEHRRWARSEVDSFWTALTSADTGVLAKAHVRAFFEPLADESPHYLGIACKIYRECSEYVHGNEVTRKADDQHEFRSELFQQWHDLVSASALVTSYALFARYASSLKHEDLLKLEDVILGQLGHLSAVRALFSEGRNSG